MFEKIQDNKIVYHDEAMDLIDEIYAIEYEKDMKFVEGCAQHLKDHRSIRGSQWNILIDIFERLRFRYDQENKCE